MSFSYSGNPATSDVDQVRFLVQDTTEPGLLSDEEIRWLLIEESGPHSAAVTACRSLAMRYAGKQGSRTIGDVTVSYAAITDTYKSLTKMLETEAVRHSVVTPYLGGLSQADKDINDANGDHTERYFDDEDFPITPTQLLPGNPKP